MKTDLDKINLLLDRRIELLRLYYSGVNGHTMSMKYHIEINKKVTKELLK